MNTTLGTQHFHQLQLPDWDISSCYICLHKHKPYKGTFLDQTRCMGPFTATDKCLIESSCMHCKSPLAHINFMFLWIISRAYIIACVFLWANSYTLTHAQSDNNYNFLVSWVRQWLFCGMTRKKNDSPVFCADANNVSAESNCVNLV